MTRMPAGWDEVIYCRLHESTAQLEVLVSHEACYRPGNSAVRGLRAVRPDVLRPRLSTGLLLVDARMRPRLSRHNAGGVPADLTY